MIPSTRTNAVPSFAELIEPMFAVAIKGYGIVIWDDDRRWRVFSTSDSLAARLSARVEYALQTVPATGEEREARAALLAIAGSGLLAADCEHGPGECEDAIG